MQVRELNSTTERHMAAEWDYERRYSGKDRTHFYRIYAIIDGWGDASPGPKIADVKYEEIASQIADDHNVEREDWAHRYIIADFDRLKAEYVEAAGLDGWPADSEGRIAIRNDYRSRRFFATGGLDETPLSGTEAILTIGRN